MANIPTIKELNQQILKNLESEFETTIYPFGKSWLRGFAAVQAAKLWLYYVFGGKIQKNIAPDTADPESEGGTLERWGRIKIGRNPNPATAGQYNITITGDVDAFLPAGTIFQSDVNSTSPDQLYQLDTDYTLTSVIPQSILVRALTLGLDGQLNPNDVLELTAPVAGIDSSGTVTGEVVQPLSAESIEDYRSVVLLDFQLEPQGGSPSDFRLWSLEVQSVVNAYPYATSGQPGEVDLFIESKIEDSTDGKGTPSQALLDSVRDIIELPIVDTPSRLPMGVHDVNYLSIDAKDVLIEITGFVDIDAEKETLIFDKIKEALDEIRPFVAAIDVVANQNDSFGSNDVVGLIISAIPGSTFGNVQITIDGNVQSSAYQFIYGSIPYVEEAFITYV